MLLAMAAKTLAMVLGLLTWAKFPRLFYLNAFALGILPIWMELAATRLTGVEPGRETRPLYKAVDALVDAASFVLMPAFWFGAETGLARPIYEALLLFVLCGFFRIARFLAVGLSPAGKFIGLPVTYTGYAWIVLAGLDQLSLTWAASLLLAGLAFAMVSPKIRISPSLREPK